MLQVKAHPWFRSVDWELLRNIETRRSELRVPYDMAIDYNPSFVSDHGAEAASPSSSAESIDPEDNAKFFGDF